MSTFKEQVARDNDTFINNDEFADFHLLNGQKIKCIVDTDESATGTYSRGSSFDDNIFKCEVVIIYKYCDYKKCFKAHIESASFNNSTYIVTHFSVSDGMATLALGRTA